MLSFISRQLKKKDKLSNYFLLEENKRMPHKIISQHKHALKYILIMYIIQKHVRGLITQ